MKIALDVRETSHLSAGMTAYVRKLRAWLPQVDPLLDVVPVGGGDNFDLAEQVGLPLALLRARPALAHFPSPYVPRFVPVPYVVTVHDLIDLHFPQYGKRKVGPYYRFVVGPVLRGARGVITDDVATVDDLERFLGVRRDRVHVIALGSDDAVVPPGAPPHPRPYLLYVGNHRPHKNLELLAAAWAQLPADVTVDLVLTGPADVRFDARRERGEIVFLGHAPEDELRRWYAGACAYVHPALREGFGLPLLEALRHGTPVVAARAAVPAVLAPHVTALPSDDAAAWTRALAELLRDPAAARARTAAAQAATAALTWVHTACETAALYRRLT